ncbi:MAG: thioredoxin, partial [Gammaproteobacteria bacterium]|nr:thioredoxin [Gammaproteobacteria bacterium]
RKPESLAKSLASSLRSVTHTKVFMQSDALLVISPEHRRVFKQGHWSKAQVKEAIVRELKTPGEEIVRGAGGMAEGIPMQFKDKLVDKFRKDGLHIASAGGTAGLFSAIIPGWVASGDKGSQLVSNKY